MGITFRSGGYERRVRFGGRTIKDGEAAAIWDVRGRHRQVVGPQREWMYCSTIRFLTRHKAQSHQYILVRHRGGNVEHWQGPCDLYENPALHDEVKVHDGIHLASETECIIVYRDKAATRGQIAEGPKHSHIVVGEIAPEEEAVKRVVKGPALFMPAVGERVHEFEWSGINPESTALKKKKNVFKVLHTDQNRTWSVQLPITTSDAMVVTAHLVFGYQLESVDKVARAQDPIEKMHGALVADAQKLGASVASEQLRAGQQDAVNAKLAAIENFAYMCGTAEACGLRMRSVRVLGLKFSAELQKQADREQQLAAKLRAELAEKTQRRQLHELELEDARKKIEQEAELERKRVEMRAQLDAEAHDINLAAMQRRLALKQSEFDARQGQLQQQDESVLHFLRQLKAEGVDMTQFMCSAGGLRLAAPVLAASPLHRSVAVVESAQGMEGGGEKSAAGVSAAGVSRKKDTTNSL